jgi:hypothetical protein
MVGCGYTGAASERKPATAAPRDAVHREGRTIQPPDVCEGARFRAKGFLLQDQRRSLAARLARLAGRRGGVGGERHMALPHYASIDRQTPLSHRFSFRLPARPLPPCCIWKRSRAGYGWYISMTKTRLGRSTGQRWRSARRSAMVIPRSTPSVSPTPRCGSE